MKIKQKTLYMVFATLTFFIFLGSSAFSVFYTSQIKENNIVYAERILENLVGALEVYFDDLGIIASDTNYNYYLQNYLIQETQLETQSEENIKSKDMRNYEIFTSVFKDIINDRNDISALMIFGENKLLLEKTSYAYQYKVRDFTEHSWYKQAVEADNKMIITGPNRHDFFLGNQKDTLSVSKKISSYIDGTFLGVLLIDIHFSGIQEIIDQIYIDNDFFLSILNQEGEVVYVQPGYEEVVSDRVFLDTIDEAVPFTKGQITVGDSTSYQTICMGFERAGWQLIMGYPTSLYQKSIQNALFYIIVIAILILISMLIIIAKIIDKIVKPIERLREQMDKVDKGNLNAFVFDQTNDEIQDIGVSFNSMIDRIETLENRVIEEQEEKRKYELQALQQQINPHFLYNTLDTIVWMGEVKDDRIVKVTEALAKLFRVSLNGGEEFLTIEQEIEHIKSYLYVQGVRYHSKLTYAIRVDEAVLKYKTIKLLIQPIVENSIYHGIKKKRGKGRIEIDVYRQEDKLIIEVNDDGIGMTREEVQSLMEPKKQGCDMGIKKGGIGICNTNKRIHIAFGKEYGITCKSTLNQGTQMTITLPIIEGEQL